jgi:outer membrane protein OmpA-like peptidoglycan-associated protein
LIETGLEADKVTAKAFGANRPRFRNDSEIQRVLNNRVELIILPVEE